MTIAKICSCHLDPYDNKLIIFPGVIKYLMKLQKYLAQHDLFLSHNNCKKGQGIKVVNISSPPFFWFGLIVDPDRTEKNSHVMALPRQNTPTRLILSSSLRHLLACSTHRLQSRQQSLIFAEKPVGGSNHFHFLHFSVFRV